MARGGALFAQGERASAPSQLGRWLLALGRVAPPLTLARASALVARRPPRTGLAVGDALDGAVFVVRVLARGRYSAGARGRCVFIVANQAMLSSTQPHPRENHIMNESPH